MRWMQILEEGCHFYGQDRQSPGGLSKNHPLPLQQTPPVPATCAVSISDRNVDGEVYHLITSALDDRALGIADERLTRAPRGEY